MNDRSSSVQDTLWFYTNAENEPQGPVTVTELRQLKDAGQIAGDAQVVVAGGNEWQPIGAVLPPRERSVAAELFAHARKDSEPLPPAPPAPKKKAGRFSSVEIEQLKEALNREWRTLLALCLLYPLGAVFLYRSKAFTRDQKGGVAVFCGIVFLMVVGALPIGNRQPADTARESKTEIASAEESSTKAPSVYRTEAFPVEISVRVEGSNGALIFRGKTNLPDDTRITVMGSTALPWGQYRLSDKAIVKGGAFISQPVSPIVPAGRYRVSFVASALFQPTEVQAIFGKSGANLTGPLVKPGTPKLARLDFEMTVNGAESEAVKEALVKEITERHDGLVALLRELLAFKNTPFFHQRGFGAGGHKEWQNRVTAFENRDAGLAGDYGRGAAIFLKQLGWEYFQNKGAETEETRRSQKTIRDQLQDDSLSFD